MIIVEQEKTYLINFDNVGQITLAIDEEGKEYAVIAQTIDKEEIVMGIYKTEERAKEVLQEIVKAYTSMQILPFLQANISDNIYGKDLSKVVAYEMPKE